MGRENLTNVDESEVDMLGDDLEISSPEADLRVQVAAKYNMADAKITELGQKYLPLRIASIEDKQGYALVRAARLEVKGLLSNVEKTRKALKENSLAFGRAVDGEAKRITAMLEPIESHLEVEEKRIDREIEAVKAEKQRIQDERNQGRLNALLAVGATPSLAEVVLMTEEVFKDYLAAKTAVFEADRKAAEDVAAAEQVKAAAEAAEKARIEKETADRLEAQRAENARIAAENAATAAALKAQQDALDKQKADLDRAAHDEKIRKDIENKAAADAKRARENEEAAARAAAQVEAARPDADKLHQLAMDMETFVMPAMSTPAGKAVAAEIQAAAVKFGAFIHAKATALTSPF